MHRKSSEGSVWLIWASQSKSAIIDVRNQLGRFISYYCHPHKTTQSPNGYLELKIPLKSVESEVVKCHTVE